MYIIQLSSGLLFCRFGTISIFELSHFILFWNHSQNKYKECFTNLCLSRWVHLTTWGYHLHHRIHKLHFQTQLSRHIDTPVVSRYHVILLDSPSLRFLPEEVLDTSGTSLKSYKTRCNWNWRSLPNIFCSVLRFYIHQEVVNASDINQALKLSWLTREIPALNDLSELPSTLKTYYKPFRKIL